MNQNTTLIVVGFLVLVYLIVNFRAPVLFSKDALDARLVDRTGSDWHKDGVLVDQVNLDSAPTTVFNEDGSPKTAEFKGTVSPATKDGRYRDSYSQFKLNDEIYPNYYNKYEVFTSDYYPWWRNQRYWPYYTQSHNWMYRYPFFSSWQRPYYYNYWASPYYPSRSVLIKPYLKDRSVKDRMRQQLANDFKSSKVSS